MLAFIVFHVLLLAFGYGYFGYGEKYYNAMYFI